MYIVTCGSCFSACNLYIASPCGQQAACESARRWQQGFRTAPQVQQRRHKDRADARSKVAHVQAQEKAVHDMGMQGAAYCSHKLASMDVFRRHPPAQPTRAATLCAALRDFSILISYCHSCLGRFEVLRAIRPDGKEHMPWLHQNTGGGRGVGRRQ